VTFIEIKIKVEIHPLPAGIYIQTNNTMLRETSSKRIVKVRKTFTTRVTKDYRPYQTINVKLTYEGSDELHTISVKSELASHNRKAVKSLIP
jgi:hypothetical protein